MRLKRILFFLFAAICTSGVCYSQKQTHTWYFGKKSGLSFNQDPPQVLYNGQFNTIEGSSSYSDNNGKLLFYTNGNIIINKEQGLMKNGNNILGNVSSTCNSVIVPQPDKPGIYFLFTVGAANYPFEGFRYSIIDMNKENGLGEVLFKNEILEEESFEKLAAVRHCNKKDVWIVTRKWNSDEYHTYLLTTSGINTNPVLSNSGLTVGGYFNNALGTLKFSPDGKKLVAIHSFENDLVELMDFDNTTGAITNPVTFKPNTMPADGSYMGVYGAEFSPNAQLLYVSANNNIQEAAVVYQFDITTMNAASILNTKRVISQTSSFRGGSLQAGPDEKIYFTMWNDSAISVIDNPDVYGAGCNFKYHKIKMSAGEKQPLQYGLPTFIAGDMYIAHTPFDFSTVSNCTSFNVAYNLNKTSGVDSVKWDFGDGTQSTILSPTHTYAAGGNYVVTLTIYKNDCTGSEIISHPLFFGGTSSNIFLPGDTSFCSLKNYILSANVSAQSYLWNTGATSNSIDISTPGIYWLDVVRNGCVGRDSITISLLQPVSLNLGNDTTVCVNKPITLDAGVAGTYIWNTGAVTKTINITRPGFYKLKVTNTAGCTASDSLAVTWGDCEIFIPSAFTPNGDGINDGFSMSNGINTQYFTMNIYNRYGQVVFSSDDPLNKWDGRFKGKELPQGLYPWVVVYKKNGSTQTEKGTVMLIR
ncbi:MAG: gliding motility-associated C-terminal domain-containing protein [Ferruginibacter sp.]